MKRNPLALVLASLAALLFLGAGCGGSGAQSTSPAVSIQRAPGPAGASAVGGAQSGAPAPAQGSTVPQTAPAVPEGPRVQRDAHITVEVPNGRFDASLDRVTALVEDRGGYISGSQARADSEDRLRTGQMTFQVPAGKFDDVVAQLRRVGTVQDMQISGTDVSQQYVDLQARLRNAQAQRDAMLALMTQAHTVSDIIAVQNQLGQVTGQIEQLEGQIAYLDHTTAYATVSVTIREAAVGTQVDDWGLRSALSQALHNFVAVIGLVIIVLGSIGPLVLAGLGALAAWRFWLRARRPRPGTTG